VWQLVLVPELALGLGGRLTECLPAGHGACRADPVIDDGFPPDAPALDG
jgi:hypothetical protein